jgi:hypothetical protein
MLGRSRELRSFVAMMSWLAAPDEEKNRLPQTHRAADRACWRVVNDY